MEYLSDAEFIVKATKLDGPQPVRHIYLNHFNEMQQYHVSVCWLEPIFMFWLIVSSAREAGSRQVRAHRRRPFDVWRLRGVGATAIPGQLL